MKPKATIAVLCQGEEEKFLGLFPVLMANREEAMNVLAAYATSMDSTPPEVLDRGGRVTVYFYDGDLVPVGVVIKIDSSDDDVRDWGELAEYAQHDAIWADEETYYDFGPYDLSVC